MQRVRRKGNTHKTGQEKEKENAGPTEYLIDLGVAMAAAAAAAVGENGEELCVGEVTDSGAGGAENAIGPDRAVGDSRPGAVGAFAADGPTILLTSTVRTAGSIDTANVCTPCEVVAVAASDALVLLGLPGGI